MQSMEISSTTHLSMDAAQASTFRRVVMPFVPPVLYEWPGFTSAIEHTVTVMFLDVAGFTRLSEVLAELGTEGAERLDHYIAEYFNALQQVIDRFDGLPIKISGDALTVVFMDRLKDQPDATLRALACAALLSQVTVEASRVALPGGNVGHLTHKIGIAKGRLYHGVVGDSELRLEPVFAGEALDRAAAAEHHATAGEVWVSPEAADGIDGRLWMATSPDGYRRLVAQLEPGLLPPPSQAPPVSQNIAEQFIPLVPRAVLEHAREGTLRFLSHHQTLTVLFIRINGINVTQAGALDRIDVHYRRAQHLIAQSGGFLSEFDAGDKGAKFIVFFGAPAVLEHPCRQAVLCARALLEATRSGDPGVDLSIGISTGRLYVGRIGCDRLAKFSAVGDRMNLAARLMSAAAGGTVLADRATLERAGDDIVWRPMVQLSIKGKTERIEAAELEVKGAAASSERRGRSLVGRALELDRLRKRIDLAHSGRGGIVLIEGTVGVGKTRVAAALGRLATDQGLKAVQHQLTTTREAPLAAFRPFLWQLLRTRSGLPHGDEAEVFAAWTATLEPELRGSAPRIASLLGIEGAEDPMFQALGPERRMKLLQRTLVDFLLYNSEHTTSLFVIDDAQHLDEPSCAVLKDCLLYTSPSPRD